MTDDELRRLETRLRVDAESGEGPACEVADDALRLLAELRRTRQDLAALRAEYERLAAKRRPED